MAQDFVPMTFEGLEHAYLHTKAAAAWLMDLLLSFILKPTVQGVLMVFFYCLVGASAISFAHVLWPWVLTTCTTLIVTVLSMAKTIIVAILDGVTSLLAMVVGLGTTASGWLKRDKLAYYELDHGPDDTPWQASSSLISRDDGHKLDEGRYNGLLPYDNDASGDELASPPPFATHKSPRTPRGRPPAPHRASSPGPEQEHYSRLADAGERSKSTRRSVRGN
ncbi:hypothetical protein PRZ48_012201 [Zasmidium cellare]|uniref:Uncharacterized protein n=1 Tax=Zasmidium cellare TaxID=395010 RepID=A0ABR0E4R9_ZASCE|nr:hypothetical protein PRZ48_012201 [Zasmidium cellare]